MALPSSGPFSAGDVNVELGRASNAAGSAADAAVRGLAGVMSGSYSARDLAGKSTAPPLRASLSESAVGGSWVWTMWGGTCKTPTVTCRVEGGRGPYRYEWQCLSSSSGKQTLSTAADVDTVYWSHDIGVWEMVWRCQVTDAQGWVAHSGEVKVFLRGGGSYS